MLTMSVQVDGAEFYPADSASRRRGGKSHVAKPKKRKPALVISVMLVCAVLLALLGFRVFSWSGRQQETALLALVNNWNPVDFCGFEPKLVKIDGGLQADTRCAEALEQMLSDCAAAGLTPYACAAYRSREEQQTLYDNMARGLVAFPGYSEHETGLAVDIVDRNYPQQDRSQAGTATQQWLMANCMRYGFILRYPDGADSVTGVVYEPWHYRYVGVDAAEQIYQLGLTMEEYVSMFYSEEAVIIFED